MNPADEYVNDQLPEKGYDFEVGDTVDVHVRIQEGDKTRIQIFNGTVIRTRGRGMRKTATVRRVVQGEGVERIFPLFSPNVVKIEAKKKGLVRRAKLYYLRDKVGKATRVKERRWTKSPKKPKTAAEKSPATSPAALESAPES